MDNWNDISTLTEQDGQVLLRGTSGYVGDNSIHMQTGHVRDGILRDDANDRYTESWPMPSEWKKL